MLTTRALVFFVGLGVAHARLAQRASESFPDTVSEIPFHPSGPSGTLPEWAAALVR